ncbi:TetR/AcrR family transcriptional regulator [Salinibacterium sp. ZJ450]|uniref:TetR/AcrR family transcriptional regulator n=1 Tax=Salinibacterium sp. ZJ450 TaxID=2708338 RepID=UPI00141E8CCE|nr:TetR/AcrR family transcriptional regulator [Salinibacterium sp. ZJ450]
MSTPDASAAVERILDSTEQCFLRYGVSKTTMDDVAQQAGVSRATVYRYFSGRDGLVEAWIRRRSARYLEDNRKWLTRWSSFAERLEEGIVEDVRRSNADPFVHLVATDPRLMSAEKGSSTLSEDLTAELWNPILDDAERTGELRQGLDRRELSDWITHLEIMFITRFDDDEDSLTRIRSFVRQFVVPAVVAPDFTNG